MIYSDQQEQKAMSSLTPAVIKTGSMRKKYIWVKNLKTETNDNNESKCILKLTKRNDTL